jgi:hypothetical protein
MCLLYDDQQLLLRRINVDQKPLKLDQEIRLPLESVGDLEICGEDSINTQRFDAGISDESNLDVSREGFSQLLQEDRFSRAHIPGQKNKTLVLENAIPNSRKTFPVLFAQPKEFRVRLKAEGVESEIVKLAIHGCGLVQCKKQ